MRRAATLFGGLLAGFVAGSFLLDSHVAAMFGPATVTWDATNCPAGVYTITSTATGLAGTFHATSTDVQLPHPSVSSIFENLSPGRFSVTAIATDADGRTFGSGSQSLISSGTAGRPPKGKLVSSTTDRALPPSDRSRAGSRQAAGAVSRPTPAHEPLIAKLADGAAPGPRIASAITPRAITLAEAADLIGDGSEWRRFDLIDLDDDGAVDVLRIEWASGAVRVWRLVR